MDLRAVEITLEDTALQQQVYELGPTTLDTYEVKLLPYPLPVQVEEWARATDIEYVAVFDGQQLVAAFPFRLTDGLLIDVVTTYDSTGEIMAFILDHVVAKVGRLRRNNDYVRVDVT